MAADTQALRLNGEPAATRVVPHAQARADLAVSVGLGALYLFLSFLKMKSYWLDGRVWGEEGAVFFADMARARSLANLVYLYHGHLSLANNLVIAAATLVNFKHVPLVLVYGAWLMQSIPILVLIRWRDQLGVTPLHVAVFLVALVGLPQAPEVWATATNLHFHFSLLAALIAALPLFDGYPTITFRALLLVSGLTSLPADLLLPVFLVAAVHGRSRERYIQSGILAATSLVQLFLLTVHHFETGPRSLALDPMDTWLAIVAQQLIAPLFGVSVGTRLTALLGEASNLDIGALLFAAICTVPLLLAGWRILACADRRAITLAGAGLVLAVLSVATSIDEKKYTLISTWIGGRYFFVPNACLMLALLLSSSALTRLGRAVLCVVLVAAALPRLDSVLVLGGPPWREAYAAAISSNADAVEIWPAPWTMPNFSRVGGVATSVAPTPAIRSAQVASQCNVTMDEVSTDSGDEGVLRVASHIHLAGSMTMQDAPTTADAAPVVLVLRQKVLVAAVRAVGPPAGGPESAPRPGAFQADLALGSLPAGPYMLALGQMSGDRLLVCPKWHVRFDKSP
jgi:hypothetical protein